MSLTRLIATLPEPLFSTYTIEDVLGVGAYAVVYRIRSKRSLEAFALKVVEKEPMRVRLMLPQLEREVDLLEENGGLPHVVELLDVMKTSTHFFMRFDLCHESLEDLCKEHGPMSEDVAFRWLRQACLGVQGLHANDVIHRDLKPSNFLVDLDGTLRICDFGWACKEEDELSGQCGTPDYSPPETRGNGPVHTKKVDVYGLATSFQHFLLGRVPKGLNDLPKGLSKSTLELFRELTDEDPDERPTIDELLARPELAENIIEQLWSHWRSFFDVPMFSTRQKASPEDISCGLGEFY